jgi:hypothetical protein
MLKGALSTSPAPLKDKPKVKKAPKQKPKDQPRRVDSDLLASTILRDGKGESMAKKAKKAKKAKSAVKKTAKKTNKKFRFRHPGDKPPKR